jgi:putative chitinase
MITAQQFSDALTLPLARAEEWIAPMNTAMERFDVNTPKRHAAFLAQVMYESAAFTALEENLNYSASRLRAIFPTHFTAAEAQQYQHNPAAIANRVYANRYGNGDEASGDGWTFRGRGLIQITFRDNYRACGGGLGISLETGPDALTQPDNAALSAAWYWKSHGCNELADAGDFVRITRAINGGTNGLAQRTALYRHALAIFTQQE